MCWCAASLVTTMHDKNYDKFREFYYGARNPLRNNTDPTDQRAIQNALGDWADSEVIGKASDRKSVV